MMHTESYELAAWPFRLTPDPGFFFAVPQHEEILESFRSSRGTGKGFRVLTGEIGAGKTMLFRVMRSELQASGARVAEVVTSNVGPGALLTLLAAQFGIVAPEDEAHDVSTSLGAYLAGCQSKGQRVVAFIDEAQNLPLPSVEALYPLADLGVGGQPALEIFLLGQPELGQVFDRDSAGGAGRRTVWRHHLRPLREADTCGFVLHRLKAAGWRGRPAFTADARRLIHRQTGGVPRRIVVLCNRLLVHAQLENLAEIDGRVVRQVLGDARREGLPIGDVIDAGTPNADAAVPRSARRPGTAAEGLADAWPGRERRPAGPSPDLLRAVERAIGVTEGPPKLPPADLLRAVEKAIGPPGEAAREGPRQGQTPAASLDAVPRPPDGAAKRFSPPPVPAGDGATGAASGLYPDDHRRAVSIAAEASVAEAPGGRSTAASGRSRGPADPAAAASDGPLALRTASSEPRCHHATGRRRFRPLPLAMALLAGLAVSTVAGPVEDGRLVPDLHGNQASDCPTCSGESDAAAPPGDIGTPAVPAPAPGESRVAPGEPPALGESGPDSTRADVPARASAPSGAARLAPFQRPDGAVAASAPPADTGADASAGLHEDRQGTAELDHAAATGAESEPGPSVSLIRLVLTRRVVDREPSGSVASFSAADRQAFAFVRLDNPGPPTEVSFVWYRDDAMRSIVRTEVGTSGAWRTWSSVRLSPGSWRVDVLAPDGRLIGAQSFVVAP